MCRNISYCDVLCCPALGSAGLYVWTCNDFAVSDAPVDVLIDEAIVALRAGMVVGIPTDTVYGLAVDPEVVGSTDRLFALKGRARSVELPVLVSGMQQADLLAGPGGMALAPRRLAERWWPGGLTIVVPRRLGLGWSLGGNEDTIGLRCPAHLELRSLCEEVGPLAVSSANRHGEPPLTTVAEVRRVFGNDLGVVVDGGVCDNAPSTVVGFVTEEPTCLREGAVSWISVLESLG